jgi:NDP-sugar pyrophosphorylase family protein
VSTSLPALVLAAGLGVRLRPLTEVRAKPALPVAGEPMIGRIIDWLVAHGITSLVINLHHLPHTVTAQVGDGSDRGARVRYSWESPHVLGSAGGPRQALPLLDSDTFLIANGDTLTDLDPQRLASAHRATGALVTLALTPNAEPERYGGVRIDAAGRVVGFAPRGAAAGSFHFVGVQVATAAAFEAVPPGTAARTIGGVYDRLIAARPGAVRGEVVETRFWDVGTVSDYWTTSEALGRTAQSGRTFFGARATIDRSARLIRSIVWDDVTVGAGATLEECIVSDGVRVPAGATYRRSVLVRRPETGELSVTPL